MKVIIQKPDFDTCLTALITGVSETDEIIVSRGDASPDVLNNPGILCIEAGGSRQTDLNNFDHHNTDQKFQPACMQAYEAKEQSNQKLKRLVDYVCMVDDSPSFHPFVEFPSLSNIFSGMLLVERNPTTQLFKGIEMLKKVLDKNIAPFGTMPDLEKWREFKKAKRVNQKKVMETIDNAEYFISKGGLKIGYIQSDFIGGFGVLYSQGCDIVILYNSKFGEPPYPKFSIAGNKINVYKLVEIFNNIEPGWGGRDTIIGSPRTGTKLKTQEVIEIVKNIFY